MTWNIWHGGLHGTKINEFAKDSSNTVNVVKVLNQEIPDILFMQETYCCGMEIAKEAGFPYSRRASANLSIHSKYPILDTIAIYKPFNAHGVIIDVSGTKILCVNVWLNYLPKYFEDIKILPPDSLQRGELTTRHKEISTILHEVDSINRMLKMPVIIGGDFNSGSHFDWVESTKESHYNKIVEWPVSKKMVASGYKDSFREGNTDPNLTLTGTYGFLFDDIISDRIDFIYYKGDTLINRHSKMVHADPPGGFFNSDHRAILTVFEVHH
jgi:exonuclease III